MEFKQSLQIAQFIDVIPKKQGYIWDKRSMVVYRHEILHLLLALWGFGPLFHQLQPLGQT